MTGSPAAIIFDLDGTLLNTLSSLAACVNRVLAHYGFPAHPDSAYRQFIGDGAEACLRRAIPASSVSDSLVADALVRQREDYQLHWKEKVEIYSGIDQLLASINELDLPLAVLSNKDDQFTRQCVTHFFPDVRFCAIRGFSTDTPHKPNPTGALAIATDLGLDPSSILLIGDTEIDINTAKNAGMKSMGALWGFRDQHELKTAGADVIVAQPLDVRKWLTGRVALSLKV